MDVTKQNFERIFPQFLKLLDSCDFYAFDLEMTGITDPTELDHPIDAPAHVRFPGKVAAAEKFSVVQLGICLFHRDGAHVTPTVPTDTDDDGDVVIGAPSPSLPKRRVPAGYTARPFNFYVFSADGSSDCVMNVETVSQFLTKHGMDFTKWIAQGIPYLNKEKAAELRAAIDDDCKSPANFDQALLATIEQGDGKMFTELMAHAQNFAEEVEADSATPPMKFPYFKNRSTMALFEQYIASLGLSKHSERRPQGGSVYTIVSESEKTHRKREKAEETVGISRLYEALGKSRKIAVGHNCLLDHLFMHAAFDGSKLKTLADFKRVMRGRFPLTFDTRALALHPSINVDSKTNQNLEGQYRYFRDLHKNKVTTSFALGFEAYDCCPSRAHEAAYDALLTGQLLLYLTYELGDGTLEGLFKHKNRIPMFRCLETIDLAKENDSVMHDGPVLVFKYPAGALHTTRIEGMISASSPLKGRLLWNRDCTFLFSDKRGRGELFERYVEDIRVKLAEAVRGAELEVVIQ